LFSFALIRGSEPRATGTSKKPRKVALFYPLLGQYR
jgi:hypothetical protein